MMYVLVECSTSDNSFTSTENDDVSGVKYPAVFVDRPTIRKRVAQSLF